ncbi:hypothetical protein JN535_02260 [Cellulosimicrobium cellulans]|uniref:hypothetical protein n=1 Tax=Cellulosimicrobium cellulans TaxID=1710 RepID=UPI0019638E3B|nr:hypothetical protein [Cellulosimicrobium cellulans]MBN0038997.1 hypothetical protein [Cellulosimicrobium cellulans]
MSGVDVRAAGEGTGDARVVGSLTAEPGATTLVAPVLVRDFRRLLRLFPYTYRRAHEAEMLGHLLDGAEPGRSRPTRAERWDLVCAAAREWLLAPLGSTPRQRRAATALLFVLLPAALVVMAARVLAFAAAIVRATLGPDGSAPLVATVPTALMWALWVVAVTLALAGARRVGLVVAVLAAAAGVAALVVSVAVGSAYAAYLDAPWVVALVAYAGVLAARRTCRVGAESLALRAATVGAMALALGAFVAATYSDAARLETPWWSGGGLVSWTLQAIAAPVVVLLGAALLWRRARQAVPVLGGLALGMLLSRSTFFWSGTVPVETADLGNVLALLGCAAAATLALRWAVNRLDELSEARASHRALLAAASGSPGPRAPHPGEMTAV